MTADPVCLDNVGLRSFHGDENVTDVIAVATIEADEAIASSDFLKIMGISSPKGAN